MATSWETFSLEFRGGLRGDMGKLQQGSQEPGSATILENYEVSRDGGYRRVLGYNKFDTTMVPGVGPVLNVTLTNNGRVVAARATLTPSTDYHISDGIGWTSLGTVGAGAFRVRSRRFQFGADEKIVFVDGVNYPQVLNLTTNAMTAISETDLLGATHAVVFKQHLFISKGAELTFSVPYAETDWTPANGAGSFNVGGAISGMVVFRNQLFIFTQNKVQTITGSSFADFKLDPVAEGIGCLFQETIQEVGGDVMFLAQDGLRLLSATERINDFGLDLASKKLGSDFRDFLAGTNVYTSLVIRDKAQYRFFVYKEAVTPEASTGAICTKLSDQGADDLQWSTTKGFKVFTSDSFYTNVGEKVIFSNEDGYIYNMDVSNSFDGEEIESVYKSPMLPINDPKVRKTLHRMVLFTDTSNTLDLRCQIQYDVANFTNFNRVASPAVDINLQNQLVFFYGDDAAIFGVATYGEDVESVFETPLVGSGKTITLEIRSRDTLGAYLLESIVFDFQTHDKQ